MINKKTLFVTAVLILFSIAPHVLAQGFVPLAPIEGLTKGVAANTEGIAVFFNNLYKYLIGMAAVLAVIMIIWGGLEYSTQDSPGSKSNGKDRILQAIFGLILVLSPVLVFSIINPSILNLSINLKPLDTRSGTPVRPVGDGGPTTNPNCAPGSSISNANCVIFNEDYYVSRPPRSWCLVPKDTSRGAYYCTRDETTCGIAISTFGTGNVVNGRNGCTLTPP